MNFKRKSYNKTAVEAQISTFTTSDGITEYQILFSGTDPLIPFQDQFKNILETYAIVVKDELENGAIAVFRRYFLSDAANQTESILAWECETNLCPLSIVQQPPLNNTKVAMWCYFQTGVIMKTDKSGILSITHNGYEHFWTGSAYNKEINSEFQTRLLLNDYIMQLMHHQCTLAANCIRTWFFVQNVDVNYAGMVKARKEVFITQNLTEKSHYIASTGIEGRNADPAVLVQMDSYAVKGLDEGQIQYLYAPSHLNSTYDYGVTFERGTAITYGDRKHVFISGTASIDNQGEILYQNNIVKQTERMFENISVLLEEADSSMNDIVQSITYLRDVSDYYVVKNYIETHYPNMPNLIVLAPVCRPGWLIETECFAMTPTKSSYKNL